MYSTAPQWIRDLAFPDATRALMLYHIEKDLSYTRGQNPIWLLFNEFILSPEYGAGLKNRSTSSVGIDGYDYGNEWNYYSPWAENSNDSSLIEAAFIKAREVDPGATLLLNDYQDEQIDLARSEYFFQFASGLKAEGIPIDGVGFQMHNYIDPDGTLTWKKPFTWPWEWEHVDLNTYLNNVDLNVRRYARVGLKVAFTEVDGFIKIDDLDLTSAEGRAEYDRRLEWQAKYYAGLLKIAMENENVILYHTWGVTDRYEGNSDTSLPEYSDGYIFDRNYNPKPAYYAMLELLQAP
jgi:endo-1,4-beta-xylanase